MTPEVQAKVTRWLELRHMARTDLMYLAHDVLQYKDIEEVPHRKLMDCLQKFRGGTDRYDQNTGAWISYEPACDLWHLQSPRFRLILWPRGHLKTTICTISHTIQWLINYPDVRILISGAVGDQPTKMLLEIKAHFQHNEFFRWLFPEMVPPAKNVSEFGTQENFTVPNRARKWLKEPSVSVSSIGKVVSSFHYEVEKFSDLVDKENIKTPNQIRDVIDHFKYCDPLLERSPVPPHHGWKDVEGTRYGIAELYGHILREEWKRDEKSWVVSVESADPRDRAEKTPLWPTRFPATELKRIEDDDEFQYSSQYRQRPVPESSALADAREIQFIPRAQAKAVCTRYHTTIDLHGMENNVGNDYTVINTCGYDRDGRVYDVDIRRGRFSPFDTIAHIFDVHKTWLPVDMKIEKDAHARVLLPFLFRMCSKLQIFPNIVPIKRDSRQSKQQRIRNLQAWFKSGAIRFCDDLPNKLDLMEEILNFPDPSIHDDILDTLADQFQNRDGGVEYDVSPGMPIPHIPTNRPWEINRFLGWGEDGSPRWLLDYEEPQREIARTGVFR